jgi:hypothetical protein
MFWHVYLTPFEILHFGKPAEISKAPHFLISSTGFPLNNLWLYHLKKLCPVTFIYGITFRKKFKLLTYLFYPRLQMYAEQCLVAMF